MAAPRFGRFPAADASSGCDPRSCARTWAQSHRSGHKKRRKPRGRRRVRTSAVASPALAGPGSRRTAECVSRAESILRLEAPARRRLRRLLRADLHDQPAAPLPPPPRQCLAACPSAHSGAESVGVLSLSIPWSVCRFHVERSWKEPPAPCEPLAPTTRRTRDGRGTYRKSARTVNPALLHHARSTAVVRGRRSAFGD